MTVPEFAAVCRERCGGQAQGFEKKADMPCGNSYTDDGGQEQFVFCGFHWMALVGISG